MLSLLTMFTFELTREVGSSYIRIVLHKNGGYKEISKQNQKLILRMRSGYKAAKDWRFRIRRTRKVQDGENVKFAPLLSMDTYIDMPGLDNF